jgi:Flp pilus assembly protein TadD
LERILQLIPEDLESKLNMAVCNSRAGNNHKAIEIYRELALKIPDDFKVWVGLAACEAKVGNMNDASIARTKRLQIKYSLSKLTN